MRLRLGIAVLGVFLLSAAPAFAAQADGPMFISSDPEAGQEVNETPEEVRITFSEPLDPSSQIKIVDECERRIDDGATSVEANEMRTGYKTTPAGTYTVFYAASGLGGVTGETSSSFQFIVLGGKTCDGGSHGDGHGSEDGGGHEGSEHGSGDGDHEGGGHGSEDGGGYEGGGHQGGEHEGSGDGHGGSGHSGGSGTHSGSETHSGSGSGSHSGSGSGTHSGSGSGTHSGSGSSGSHSSSSGSHSSSGGSHGSGGGGHGSSQEHGEENNAGHGSGHSAQGESDASAAGTNFAAEGTPAPFAGVEGSAVLMALGAALVLGAGGGWVIRQNNLF